MFQRSSAARPGERQSGTIAAIRSRRLRLAGFVEGDAMTVNAAEGIHPRGRELSLAWLTGTIMTGLTSVLLMGAALYVSVGGQANFSTPYDAMQIAPTETVPAGAATNEKVDRVRPLSRTRSDKAVIEASIRSVVDGRSMLTSQQFLRVDATLATSTTSLSADVPAFDPAALIEAAPPIPAATGPMPEIYASDVEGEVAVTMAAYPVTLIPPSSVTDQQAAAFIGLALQDAFGEEEPALGYSIASDPMMVDAAGRNGVAENVTALAKTLLPTEGSGRSERIVTLREAGTLQDHLLRNGFTEATYRMVARTLANVLPNETLPAGTKLRILMGASRTSPEPVPYRLSIYMHDPRSGAVAHAATVALTDDGTYVIGLAPPTVDLPEEDVEAVDVTELPTLYSAIWETARRQNIDDETTRQIVAMFAYEADLNEKIALGDGIKLLLTQPADGPAQLLYASLDIAGSARELFRFQGSDGTVDYYSPDGATAKRFLTRRPVQGGGRLTSRYGYRIHPIFKTRRLHSGLDLAAPLNTPIYAGGDGIVRIAQWTGGFGRYVEIDHVNGYQTSYAHMNRIADGLKAGMQVKQGQLVGYVGSTGNSTGNHLHYEIRINGRTVDPLSVKLPRDRELPGPSQAAFDQTTAQIRQLMARTPQIAQLPDTTPAAGTRS